MRYFLFRFFSRWQNWLGIGIILGFLFVALAAPWLAPQEDPENPSLYQVAPEAGRTVSSRRTPLPPGGSLPLGTVPGGLDIYYTLVWGAYPALRFGLIVALSSAAIGVMVGAVSGYLGGTVNGFSMRVTDAFLAFPAIAGVFLFWQVMAPINTGAQPTSLQQTLWDLNLHPVMLALILFSWMPYARLINANVAVLKGAEYVMAARTIGATHSRIIFRHLLPNGAAPLIVMTARDVGAMVILEASFTFIGIGGFLPWGVLLVASRDWIIGLGGNPLVNWWLFLPATLVLVLFGIGWNLLGDGLNDALDPRSSQSKNI